MVKVEIIGINMQENFLLFSPLSILSILPSGPMDTEGSEYNENDLYQSHILIHACNCQFFWIFP